MRMTISSSLTGLLLLTLHCSAMAEDANLSDYFGFRAMMSSRSAQIPARCSPQI